jgi:hypothetical protein
MRFSWLRKMNVSDFAAQAPSMLGLPAWPHWRVSTDQTVGTVWGWHLAPSAARVAMVFSWLTTGSSLLLISWYCWGFYHIPDWLRIGVNTIGSWLGWSLDSIQRKWIYVGLWIACWLAWRIWERLIYVALCTVLLKRTTIRFTADAVQVGWFGRRYLRSSTIPVGFSAPQHPQLPWLLLKAQLRNSNVLTVFYQQIRILQMAHGYASLTIAQFTSPVDAERFTAVCRFASSYPLKSPEQSPLRGNTTQTEVSNARDI